MLAADAPPLMAAPSSSTASSPSPASSGAPAQPPHVGSNARSTALTTVPTKGALTWMRQLALVVVYYLMLKAAATNPIAANLREHLRAKLLASRQRGIADTVRAFFHR